MAAPLELLQGGRSRPRNPHPRQTVVLNADDWLGLAPGLPEHLFGARAWAVTTKGLRVTYIDAPNATGGQGITVGTGYERVDSANLPLDTSSDPTIRLHSLLRTDEAGKIGSDSFETNDYDLTIIAATGGDGSTAGSGELHRIVPGTGSWTQIPYVAHAGYTSATNMTGGRDGQSWDESMPFSASFAAGSSSHVPSASGGTGANLGLPVMVYTNNVDPVYVFPADIHGGGGGNANRHSFTELHAGTLEPFYAKCCFAWEGRMMYGGTSEAGTRHPQRIRWSASFDASPDPAVAGAGFFDIRELNGQFLRFENLDPFLVAYFTDGIVFLERTGQSSAPHRFRVITDHRGLLGGHAIAHISPREHFLIATDGFYILNASGEFREVGVVQDQFNTYRKWHDFFFASCDLSNAHRIQCHYNQFTACVHISWPNQNTGRQEVWTWDKRRDAIYPESWSEQPNQVLCFTDHNDVIRQAIAWNAAEAPTTWEDLTAFGGSTWASGSALFGRSNLYHGTVDGLVFTHNQDTETLDGQEPVWNLLTARQPVGDVREQAAWEDIYVEAVDLGNPQNLSMQLDVETMLGSSNSTVASSAMSVAGSQTNNILLHRLYPRLSGNYGRLNLAGEGKIGIRQVFMDIRVSPSRVR